MPAPAKTQWWDDVVSVDSFELFNGVHLLWGDRVRVLEEDNATGRVKIQGRGTVAWVPADILGGEPLLELYIIDVGQGDGILVVTPEGHHLMIDGGFQRAKQQTGKSAADFIDWKFHKEYLLGAERDDPALNMIRLDAMIASHADADHYGGLRDLIDRDTEHYEEELDSEGTTVEAFYHQGLCPQQGGTDKLGTKADGFFVDLLEDRASLEEGIKTDGGAGDLVIRGWWRDFLAAVADQTTKAGDPTPVVRLSQVTEFLPGFEPGEAEVTVRVLAPVEQDVGGRPGLRDLGDEGENKNGHSVALRLDYRDRRLLLTGDLNEQSHADIIEHYGDDFDALWRADVAKACHHGSHHVDFRFLRGVAALSTIFSSGDANTFDHPRAWVLGGSAIAGRVIEDPARHRLRAPLIYSTEVARSVNLGPVDQLRRYADPQEYGLATDPPLATVSGEVTLSTWRLIFDRDGTSGKDMIPMAGVRAVKGIVYGLVNVRTDGHRLLFAVRNEGNQSWSMETLEPDEIDRAIRYVPEGGAG